MTPFRIFTWHVHGSYLDSLARTGHEILIPVSDDERPGYGGRWPEWGPNVIEVPASVVGEVRFDAVLFQSRRNWEIDQWDTLTPEQRRLPRLYLEHDPPREHPTDTRHWVSDPDVMLVHVSHFNALMWDNGATPVRVVEHGVAIPDGVRYRGALPRGIVVINDLATRGRRLGLDLFLDARREVPLDLVGMNSTELGGLGEVRRTDLAAFEADYRFYFHPIRYTSLGLALLEAMLVGMPVVAFATTETPVVLENGVTGIVAMEPRRLVDGMKALLADRGLAATIGEAGRRMAEERFSIPRFADDWTKVLTEVIGRRSGDTAVAPWPSKRDDATRPPGGARGATWPATPATNDTSGAPAPIATPRGDAVAERELAR